VGNKLNKLLFYLASLGPLGFSPLAPGTIGSLFTIVLLAIYPLYFWDKVILGIIIFIGGSYLSTQIEKKQTQKDPSFIIIDEVGGQLITFLWIDKLNIWILILGFIIFRFLDIFKPWPICEAEKLPRGVGIMADDYLAGFIGSIILWGINFYLQ